MNCTNLTKLILQSNFLEGNISIFNFSSLHQLTIIDLGVNKFFGNLPVSLYSCKSLTAIRLAVNQLEGQILPEVHQLKFLSFLSLGDNGLTNITSTIKILMRCKALSVVFLGRNFLNEAMPSDDNIVDYDGFENLRFLRLDGCHLTGQLPIWLSRLKKLEVLQLWSNRITGPIPNWLSTLPRLFHLNLYDNHISGEFPKELCALPALVSPKDLENNNPLDLPLFGTTFGLVNFLSNIQPAINIAKNNIRGNIPDDIRHLKLLHGLNLSYNNFSGNILDQILELTNLEVLDLSGNRLSGKIPSSLGSLHFLRDFRVANNNLHGPIPSSTQLQSFDASAYEGNPGLCGPPLPHECAHTVSNKEDICDEDDEPRIPWFPITVVLGFVTGFWGVCGSLVLSYKWRIAYFQFMDDVKDRCIIFFFKIAYWSL